MLLQLFVGVVNTELLQTVKMEVLKAVDVKKAWKRKEGREQGYLVNSKACVTINFIQGKTKVKSIGYWTQEKDWEPATQN